MAYKKVAGFPDVGNKLQAPTKKSLFERQKAEAEAKRLREAAETAAVYEDFVKSFDEEETDGGPGQDAPSRGRFGGGRHFSRGGLPSGPNIAGRGFGGRGGLGSGPGSLGPPPMNAGRKRNFEGFSQGPPRREREDRGLLAFDDYENDTAPSNVLRTSDDEEENKGKDEEKAVAKPTLRLASLPPGTSPAVIKALIPTNLVVDNVQILPPSGPGQTSERKSMSAIVTLAKETPANEIDTAVTSLQNKYLGFGFYLNLHRHLSSAAISSSTPAQTLGSSTTSHPFGAKAVELPSIGRGAPPPHRGFAPPTSYGPSVPQLGRGGPLLHVPVQPPSDIRELKLIHKTIESLLTHGPEFEALLMSRPSVQREERWAWLWDARSVGGIWYRWRLWEVLTGTQSRRGQGKYLPLFEGSSAWKQPDAPLAYEFTTKIDEFVSDSEYVSSDEDDSGDEGRGRGPLPGDPNALTDDGKAYLNPLEKAKLTHLLSRLPTSIGKLRKGDVARVTAFAISHAGRGADEVVGTIISNIEKPFAYTSANLDRRIDKEGNGNDEAEEDSDTSSASLIGVYIISDILSSSSTSGVRHAWRYRQLFENELKKRKVFERLGRMERKFNWGRLRAEKWKRSVGNVLSLWEGWCVFPQESQEHFVNVFNNPPLLPAEEKEAKEKEEAAAKEKGKSKWKPVDVARQAPKEEIMEDVEGTPMEDLDGEPMAEDEDLDGVPMEEDEDFDGFSIEDDNEFPPPSSPVPANNPEKESNKQSTTIPKTAASAPLGQPRRRPKAVDMFADSDDDD